MNAHAHPPEAQPSLAQAIAALAGDLRAHADRRGQDWGPIAALHALLLTALARLFGRLETLALAWQQGIVPTPAPTRRRRAQPAPAPAEPPRTRAASARRPAIARSPARNVPESASCAARIHLMPRPRAARAAPASHSVCLAHALPLSPTFSKPAQARMPNHAHFIGISK